MPFLYSGERFPLHHQLAVRATRHIARQMKASGKENTRLCTVQAVDGACRRFAVPWASVLLLEDGCLDSTTVIAYSRMLMSTVPGVFVFDPQFYASGMEGSLQSGYTIEGIVRVFLSAVDGVLGLFGFQKLLVPVWLRKSHWALGVVNLEEQRFELYDSLGTQSEDLDNFVESIAVFMTEYEAHIGRGHHLNYRSWERVTGERVQTDTTSCGVYMLVTMECCARNKPVELKESASYYRMALTDLFRRFPRVG